MKKYLIPLLLAFITFNCFAQNTITGRVVNKADNSPVPNAVVFLNNTGIQAVTDNSGKYTLRNVVPSAYQIVVTIVGYDSYKSPISIKGDTKLDDIAITPKNEVLKDVTITEKYKLSPYFSNFELQFFGSTLFARQCKIINPRAVLFYDTDPSGSFSAKSNQFLEIENGALGYKIKFLLIYFIYDAKLNKSYYNGESYYEPMKGTPAQEHEWEKNRMECYQGSVMQLLRAIIADSVAENGFRIKRAHRENNPYFNKNGMVTDPYDLDRYMDFFGNTDNTLYNDKIANHKTAGKDILLTTNQNGLYALPGKSATDSTGNNALFIEHIKDVVPGPDGKPIHVPWIWNQTITFMTFSKPYVIFDHYGKILNPRAVDYSGFFSEQTRVGTMLPYDFKPELH
jgi:hypothetical protein